MSYKAIKTVLVASCVIALLYHLLRPLSPSEWAAQISNLDINQAFHTRQFFDDRSIMFDGGIVCGELSIPDNQVETVISEAIQEKYAYSESLGKSTRLGFAMDHSCSSQTNPDLPKHKGYYKVFLFNDKETQVAVIDIDAKRIYMFKAKASPSF